MSVDVLSRRQECVLGRFVPRGVAVVERACVLLDEAGQEVAEAMRVIEHIRHTRWHPLEGFMSAPNARFDPGDAVGYGDSISEIVTRTAECRHPVQLLNQLWWLEDRLTQSLRELGLRARWGGCRVFASDTALTLMPTPSRKCIVERVKTLQVWGQ